MSDRPTRSVELARLRRWWRRTVRVRSIRPWWRRFKRNGYRPDRCDHCGHRFRWTRDGRHASGNRDGKVWHGPCIALQTWRSKADERLAVLGTICDVWSITQRDVTGLVELQTPDNGAGVLPRDRAWRVFYDLSKETKTDA